MQAGVAGMRRLALIAVTTITVVACAGPRPTPTAPPSSPAPSAPAPSAPAPSAPPVAAPSAPAPSATSPGPSVAAPSALPTAGPSAASSAGAPALLVTAHDLSFTPREITADGGAAVRLTLHNAGRIVHNLTIDELGVQIVASPGQTESVDLADVPPGSYTFYCSVSGHRQAGMFGTLTVK